GLIVKLTYILVRKKDHEAQDEFTLQYIGEHAMHTPASALPQAIGEIHRMGDMAVQNLNDACEALISNRSDLIRNVMDKEKVIDYLSQEITKYLINANQLSLPISDRKMLAGLFHVVNDIERIGDHAVNIAEDAEKKIEGGYTFSTHGEGELREMIELVNQEIELSFKMFYNNDKNHLDAILEYEDKVDKMELAIQDNYVRRLNEGICKPEAGIMFSDLASNLERVGDHATNIAFSILDEDPETDKEKELLEHLEEVT
ncbi:MAG: Na/Pi cotransporter family protein, partial [Lachnospiraceae bacterium]|nr:Na/Pi cotransporter family protein [Lachnospiraceae bacterium]